MRGRGVGIEFQREFAPKFRKEYNRFLDYDSITATKIAELIVDILKHPRDGIGHPERLRHLGENVWSRHIDKKNQLVYKIIDDVIRFECCSGHYTDH
jgi:toxin YoeB